MSDFIFNTKVDEPPLNTKVLVLDKTGGGIHRYIKINKGDGQFFDVLGTSGEYVGRIDSWRFLTVEEEILESGQFTLN